MRFNLDGSGARRVRPAQPVDFAWRPRTNALYATDNGRDLLGDDFRPTSSTRSCKAVYGWPFANANRIPIGLRHNHAAEIAASRPPVHEFSAHVAALGITF